MRVELDVISSNGNNRGNEEISSTDEEGPQVGTGEEEKRLVPDSENRGDPVRIAGRKGVKLQHSYATPGRYVSQRMHKGIVCVHDTACCGQMARQETHRTQKGA